MAVSNELWCLKSSRDETLYLSGHKWDHWTHDVQGALMFPTMEDARKFRDDWTKTHKPHWRVMVKRFI